MTYIDKRLAEAQEAALWARAKQSQDWDALLFFYAMLGRWNHFTEASRAMAPGAAAPVLRDVLILELEPERWPTIEQEAVASGNTWLCLSFAKFLLSRGEVEPALKLAGARFKAAPSDPMLFSLLARFFLQDGERAHAKSFAERALRINPKQKDVQALVDGDLPVAPLDLRLIPELRSVGFYLPVYNVERYIRTAIEGLLAQSYPLSEVVVVDDASPDASLEIAQEYPVRTVRHQENKGLAAARNTAFAEMHSEYVGAIDTDAWPAPHYTRNALMEFEANPGPVVGVGGKLVERHTAAAADRYRMRYLGQDCGDYRECPAPTLLGCNTVYKREVVLQIGGYNEQYRTHHEDADIAQRLLDAGHWLVYTPHAVAYHERRDTAITAAQTRWNYFYWFNAERGFFDSAMGLRGLLVMDVEAAAKAVALDIQLGDVALFPLHLLTLVDNSFRTIREAVARGTVTEGEGRVLQIAVSDEFRAFDKERGGSLGAAIVDARQELALDVDPALELSPISAEYVPVLRGFLAILTDEVYRAMEDHLAAALGTSTD